MDEIYVTYVDDEHADNHDHDDYSWGGGGVFTNFGPSEHSVAILAQGNLHHITLTAFE